MSGAYSRDGVSIEMVADRYNDDKLLERGCKDLQIDKRRSTLCLFTLVGAVIPCERNDESHWRLGEYEDGVEGCVKTKSGLAKNL